MRFACFSGLNAAGNEELAVAIQSGRQLSRSELETVARRCAPFERVRFTVFNEFPRTETGTGKTQRSMLKKQLFEGLAATFIVRVMR